MSTSLLENSAENGPKIGEQEVGLLEDLRYLYFHLLFVTLPFTMHDDDGKARPFTDIRQYLEDRKSMAILKEAEKRRIRWAVNGCR